MAWRKSKTGLFRRLILWILIVTAAGCIIFNMVFVLQTASELTLLPHKVKQPEDIIITTSSALDDKKTSDEVTSSRGKRCIRSVCFTCWRSYKKNLYKIKLSSELFFITCYNIKFRFELFCSKFKMLLLLNAD